ncbi:MAG: hypothetical protein ACYTCN_00800 [Planctomycetota bacterium]|jgi:hypothetical protein
MKNKNILRLLENHSDKIVLAVCALISLFLLWTYVIGNPYGQKVRGQRKKLSPSEIDTYVKRQIEASIDKLDRSAPPLPPGKKYISEYERLFQSPLSEVSSTVRIPSPGVGDTVIEEDRLYALPLIPPLAEVAVGRLRGAAKIPTEELSPERPYSSATSEVEDIDLVTVSAQFDIKALYNNFQQNFAGPRLKTSWKDPRLAAPVFARLELERRAKEEQGSWGEWTSVSRADIDSYRTLIRELPMTLDDSSFGVDIWKAQYEPQDVQYSILQPEAYSFTVSRLEWMAPEFLIEAMDIMDKEAQKADRERLEERRKRNEKTTDTRRTPARRTQTRQPARRNARPDDMMRGMRENTMTPARTTARKERDIDDVQDDFEKEQLTDKSVLKSMQEPLLVWAHDDTAEPGKTYQYRIRIGVFNPIAGKNWFTEEQADFKNQIVLWSDYSDPTDELAVPKQIYVFPMETIAAKETPNNIEGVQVEVAKYYLGQWRDFSFDVYPGQIIGYEVEDDQDKDMQAGLGEDYEMMDVYGMDLDPETIDFTSGVTLVDVVKEVAWGTSLRPSISYKMLYYGQEEELRQLVIGKSAWNSDLRKTHDEIKDDIARGVKRRGSEMGPGGPADPTMLRRMMMPRMMMPQ